MLFRSKIPVIKNHADWLIEIKGDVVGTREIRKHLLSYIKGFPFSKSYRSRFARVTSKKEIFDLIDEVSELA